MNQLSTKNFILEMNDGSRFFLDDKEAESVRKSIKENVKYIEIGENMVQTFYIKKLISGADYAESERIKYGDYKCAGCKQWIPKGKECGNCRGF